MSLPERYNLQALLDKGVQPLPDLDDEAFAGLRKVVGKGPLADPLTVSSDGLLLDGHQRARALLANGRKFIDAGEIHVVSEANAENAYEYAVQLNVARRHLSVEQKAELARKLQSERHWSQATIAKLFGVSRPAVSQWLAKHPDLETDGKPLVVVGLDRKTYVNDRPPALPTSMKEPLNPWRPQGFAFKALHKVHRDLEHEMPVAVENMTALEVTTLSQLAQDVIAGLEELCNALAAKGTTADLDDEAAL